MGFTMNLRDEEGRTPLHYAASTGYLEGVRYFLDTCSHHCNERDYSGKTPIFSASRNGHVDIVRALLQHFPASKESINSDGQNLLHVAAKCGKHNLVNYLLRNHTEFHMLINHRDKEGNTPLHLAANHKHPRVVKYLAWDRRTNLNLSNYKGMTALDVAERSKKAIGSFHGKLTWVALKSAGAKRAQPLHYLLRAAASEEGNPASATNTEDFASRAEEAAEIIKSCRPDSMDIQLTDKKSNQDRINTLLVMTTLIVTVTFAAGFNMPGGYNNSVDTQKGTAILLKKSLFQVFVISNVLAMYSSLFVAVTLIWAQSGDMIMVYTGLRLVMPVLGIALTLLSLAFVAGVFLVVSDLPWLSYVVLAIGVIFLYTVLMLFTRFFFPSKKPTFRHINYYPFYLITLLASGSQWNNLNEVEED